MSCGATATRSSGTTPPPTDTVPPPAAAVGFNTLAFKSDFTQPQPAGWFGCRGSGAGHQWYAGIEGGDTAAVACPDRFTLVADGASGKGALDLKFTAADITSGRHYTTIQTADDTDSPPNACCVLGELFPYGYYMRATYRVQTTPVIPYAAVGGAWWAFWQGGNGVAPHTNPHGTTIEIDHPEHHGEMWGTGWGYWGPQLGWAVLNWSGAGSGGYFPELDFVNGLDPTTYHSYGTLVQTDGTTAIVVCGYVDDVQRGCNKFTSSDPAQFAEKKYAILFAGLANYHPGQAPTAGGVNLPITSIFKCNGQDVCLHFASPPPVHFNPVMNVSGVTGATGMNGSWQTQQFNSANDFVLLWVANDPNQGGRPVFNGAPTGGTLNALEAIDMMIADFAVYTCASWKTAVCTTQLP